MKRPVLALVVGVLVVLLAACAPATPEVIEEPTPEADATPTEVPLTEEEPDNAPDADADTDSDGPTQASDPDEPVQVVGQIEVTNALILQVYFNQRFVYLQDLTGFITRDYEYEQPLAGQILGPVIINEETGAFEFVLNLPAQPVTPLNDVDNDGSSDEGVAVWQVVMDANLIDDPFLGEDETGGWSSVFTSTVIDSENRDEIVGGSLLVWAPDSEQGFPTGFGDDGLLFTQDDPTAELPAGYSLIDLSAEPFEVVREPQLEMLLREGDIQVNDLRSLSWTEAFDALFEKASVEYPFTEEKDIDWEALYDEFAPRIAEAEEADDGQAYYNALQEFAWSIPDGHVGLNGNDFGRFQESIDGGYGINLQQLTDGRVIVSFVLPGSEAEEAGITFGDEVTEWNGVPIEEALSDVVPFSAPFSNPEAERVQELRYLVRDRIGTETEITLVQNETETETTVTLTAEADGRATFSRTSVFAGFEPTALPIEYEILPSGYGYISINSLSDDLFLTLRLWEVALQNFQQANVPGIIIDLRQNSGGAPVGAYLASFFYDGEPIDISRSFYYSEESDEFETFGPPDRLEANEDFFYGGPLAVLVSTACSSACEDVAYTLGLLDQTRIIGFHSTNGIFGEVGRGQYILPAPDATSPPYSFQIPTGVSRDLDGEIIIEGPGVVPDERVPLTEETVAAVNAGQDVELNFAVQVLEQPLGAGIEPEAPPTLTSDGSILDAVQAGVTFFETVAREEYAVEELSFAGETYTYTIPLPRSTDLLWVYAWCAEDTETLNAEWANIELNFTINGETVPVEEFGQEDIPNAGLECRFVWTVAGDWSAGENVARTEVTFLTPIGVGEDAYPAGTHVYEYSVFVQE